MFELDEQIRQLEQVGSTSELEALFLQFLRPWNISNFCLTFVSPENPLQSRVVVSAEELLRFHEEHAQRNLGKVNPLRQMLHRTTMPFTLKEAWEGAKESDDLAILRTLLQKYEIVNALVVPIHFAGHNNFATLHTQREFFSPADRRRLHLTTLAVINIWSFLVKTSPQSTIDSGISEREKEILQWAAVGRSSKDIATILNITESGVNKHLTRAQNALQAENRTAAVAIALRQGLIEI